MAGVFSGIEVTAMILFLFVLSFFILARTLYLAIAFGDDLRGDFDKIL